MPKFLIEGSYQTEGARGLVKEGGGIVARSSAT
jgi:hypothetical protein